MNITLPAGLEAISTRVDGSLKLTFGTPELSSDICAELFNYRRKEVLLLLSTGTINDLQKQALDSTTKGLKSVKNKSQSQRLREVLYRLHEQTDSMLSFYEFYNNRMEHFIDLVKGRLE